MENKKLRVRKKANPRKAKHRVPKKNPINPTFVTPVAQDARLTELLDDNSQKPATIYTKIPLKTIPTKITCGVGKPGKSASVVDMFDSSPIAVKGQIKLNLSGNAAATTNVPLIPAVPPGKNITKVYKPITPAKNTWTSVERPNLKVITESAKQQNEDEQKTVTPTVEAPAPSPKFNEGDKPTESKPVESQTVEKAVPDAKPTEIPAQTKPTGFNRRMTAASFMKYDSPFFPSYAFPKGIPRSFLKNRAKETASAQTAQNQSSNPPSLMEKTVPNPYYSQAFDQNFQFDGVGQISGQSSQISGPCVQMFGNQGPSQGEEFGQNPQAIGKSGKSGQLGKSGQKLGQGSQDKQTQGDNFAQIYVQTDNDVDQCQQYSPSDIYADSSVNEVLDDGSEQRDSPEPGSKRLSAFQRLGPPAQTKKPKLTINLLLKKDQSVREVVDPSIEEDDKYTPVHMRADVQTSTDETVMKYLMFWPWKKNLPPPRRVVTARHSKSVMLLELEQMEEIYERDSAFFQVTVVGYPPSWSKEDVLDAVLESLTGKSFIPCFIEFLKHECKFLVIRSRPALSAIHKLGFVIHKDDVELKLSISQVLLSTNQIEFIPRLVLRKRLIMAIDNELDLNLSDFTTKSDISNFIYFPLNRLSNQTELVNLQSSIPWIHLTKLNLSHNRITTLSGFKLEDSIPKLKHLDISYNHIDNMSSIIQCRNLPLNTIILEGNPVCLDYLQEMYVKVLRMLFPGLREIDGVKLSLPGDLPASKRNYCPEDARTVVEKVLEVMFPLLDANPEDRLLIENMYDINAMMTVTFMYKLRYSTTYKEHRNLFNRARWLEEGDSEYIQGAASIAKLVYRWPTLCHDPTTFTVDVLYHTLTTTIIRVNGIMKVTAESLAENEHLLSFTRTIVLNTIDGVEYKITNEMVYWDLASKETTENAFRQTTGRSKNLCLKLESPPDEDLKEKLVEIFMKLTEIERKPSQRCLELKEWHLRNALEYFYKLLKIDNIEPLYTE